MWMTGLVELFRKNFTKRLNLGAERSLGWVWDGFGLILRRDWILDWEWPRL